MKNNHSDTQILPPELTTEILLRLPVRSLLRFKCVCKLWFSQISDPQFGIYHFDLAASPTHRFLLRPKNENYYAQSIDTDIYHTSSNPLNILVPIPQPDRYNSPRKPHILGSCRGFILLYYALTRDLILWNPSNAVHKQLPYFLCWLTPENLHGFGHDPSLDEYLLILIRLGLRAHGYRTEIQVFSFKTNSRNTYSINVQYNSIVGKQFSAGSLLNGALHWLVFSQDKKVLVIIAFDLIQRSLSEIPLLEELTVEMRNVFSLRVLRGCLGVCCRVKGSAATEIWLMKEYKVHSSWTKSLVIPSYGKPCSQFSPICDTKDSGIFGSNISRRLEKLNDKGELLECFTYDSGQQLFGGNLQSAMYRESLLSLSSVTGANK